MSSSSSVSAHSSSSFTNYTDDYSLTEIAPDNVWDEVFESKSHIVVDLDASTALPSHYPLRPSPSEITDSYSIEFLKNLFFKTVSINISIFSLKSQKTGEMKNVYYVRCWDDFISCCAKNLFDAAIREVQGLSITIPNNRAFCLIPISECKKRFQAIPQEDLYEEATDGYFYLKFNNIIGNPETAAHHSYPQLANESQTSNFLHANCVALITFKCFTTQCPFIRQDSFWQMVKIGKVIVDLTNQGDIDSKKISHIPYYPTKESKTVATESFIITYQSEEEAQTIPISTVATYEIKDKKTDEITIIQRLHYQHWDDRQGIVSENLRNLAQTVIALGHQPIIHCAAGIGRTATFTAACEMEMRLIEASKDVQAAEILDECVAQIRRQRWKQCINYPQYQALHRTYVLPNE